MEKEKKMNEETLPAIFENLPAVPDDVLYQMARIAEQQTIWVKPKPGGFMVDDSLVPAIEGRVYDIKPYWCRWTDGEPEKLAMVDGEEPPEGFEARCDIGLATSNGLNIGISLAPSSFLRHWAPYCKYLTDQGLNPSEVVTRLTTKEAHSSYGVFTVVIPKLMDEPQRVRPEVVQDETEQYPPPPPPEAEVDDDDIPF